MDAGLMDSGGAPIALPVVFMIEDAMSGCFSNKRLSLESSAEGFLLFHALYQLHGFSLLV
jgi:hypothetical protein